MLPSEKSERWAWRIGIALLILAVLWIIIWVVRSASRSLHRIHDAYHQETGRAPAGTSDLPSVALRATSCPTGSRTHGAEC